MRDNTKTYLGRLCKNGHEYFDTGQSLRYISNAMCVTCHNQKECKKGIVQNDLISVDNILFKYPIKNDKYKLGRLCLHGHKYKNQNYSLRYLSNGRCIKCQECHAKENKEHYRQYRKQNKLHIYQKRREYLDTEIGKKADVRRRKQYKRKNKDKIREYKRQEYHNKKGDPTWLLNHYMGTRIRQSLQGKKHGRKWQLLVNFTTEDLINHLEKQFSGKMSWENYGKYWHIDHKLPKKWFRLHCDKELGFKLYWSLKNLRPLTKRRNLLKGEKILKIYENLFRAELLEFSVGGN